MKENILDFLHYGLMAELVIELVKKQPNFVINHVLNNNLLFAFLENIEYPRACDLL